MLEEEESISSTKSQERPMTCKERIRDKNFLKGISTVIGAVIVNLLVGSIYSFCSLAVYEITYIKRNDEKNFITIDHLSFYYPFEIIFQCLSSFISGIIEKKIGMHLTNLIGFIILGIGYFVLYLSKNFFIDISGMILGGIGTGIIYYPSTKNACLWFMDHNGIVIGIIETSISLGSFLFAFIGEKIINPKGESEDQKDALYTKEIGNNIKKYLLVQLICLVSVYILSFILMFIKEEQNNIKNEISSVNPLSLENNVRTDSNDIENISGDLISKASMEPNEKLSYKKMISKAIKSRRFILLALILILRAPGPAMIFSLFRGIGNKNHLDTSTLQRISSTNFIFECLSGIVVGFLCDYVNIKILLYFINGLMTGLLYTFGLTFKHSTAFFWYCNLSAFVNGGIYPFNDCYFMRVFGTQIYIELMGYISFLNNLAVVAISPLSYYLEKNLEEDNSDDDEGETEEEGEEEEEDEQGEKEEEEEEEEEEKEEEEKEEDEEEEENDEKENEEEEMGEGQEEEGEEFEEGQTQGDLREMLEEDGTGDEVNNTGYIILFSIFGSLNLISFILSFCLNLNPFDYGEKKKDKEEKERISEMKTTFI